VVSDMCTHANYSLSDGPLNAQNLTIECWKHGAQFCLSTGAALTPNNVGSINNVTKAIRGTITYHTT